MKDVIALLNDKRSELLDNGAQIEAAIAASGDGDGEPLKQCSSRSGRG